MAWGTFGAVHIATIFLAVAIGVVLYLILRRASDRVRTIVLGMLSFSGSAAILFNLLAWDSPVEYLPLHLCSLNAMILPIAVFSRNRILGNLLLLWSFGSFVAILLNYSVAGASIFSWTFAFYYFPHVLECVIPILLFVFGLVKPDARCILSTIGITLGAYSLIHLINVWINAYCVENNLQNYAGEVIQVNYMFSISPENPLLALFYSIIPSPYWYMFLAVPVAAAYLAVIYLPYYLRSRKSRKQDAEENT